MEARSEVAASLAAVIPLHCMICCEEYDLSERYPVVLPCGHTYLCVQCAKRLKKCMECREPLFMVPPASCTTAVTTSLPPNSTTTPFGINNNTSSANNGVLRALTPPPPAPPMYGRSTPPPASSSNYWLRGTSAFLPSNNTNQHNSAQVVTTSQKPIPLPIPKNLVLIAMMEAAERQSKQAIRKEKEREPVLVTDENDPDFSRMSSSGAGDDEDEYDLNCIIGGMATFAGPCGTYAVKEPKGLLVLPLDPRDPSYRLFVPSLLRDDEGDSGGQEEKKQESDDDESEDHQIDVPVIVQNESFVSVSKQPFPVMMGQTVQVVKSKNGVYKLARNAGYIVANKSQLVKVGGPVEESCRLEGVLETVLDRGENLGREAHENGRIAARLRDRIQKARNREPQHPIIAALPGLHADSFIESAESAEGHSQVSTSSHGHRRDARKQNTSPESSNTPPQYRPHRESRDRPFLVPNQSSDLEGDENRVLFIPNEQRVDPGSPHSIDNADLRGPAAPTTINFGCGSALISDGVFGDTGSVTPTRTVVCTRNLRTREQRFNVVDEAQVGPALSSSFDNVDFRTGLSGHSGLNARRKNRRGPRREIGMMTGLSAHHGISFTGPTRRRQQPSPSPTAQGQERSY